MNRLRTVWLALLATTAVAVAGAGISLARARRTLNLLDGLEVPPGVAIQIPTGFFENGLQVGGMGRSGCVALRIVESGCPYCTDDKTVWSALISNLLPLGCRPLAVAPSRAQVMPAEQFGPGAENQLVWVPMDWVHQFQTKVTPTTYILGRGGRILWYRIGALRAGDPARALAAVRPR